VLRLRIATPIVFLFIVAGKWHKVWADMAEMLRLPSRILQQCPVTEEIETPLHVVCPAIAEETAAARPKYLKIVDQRDIQQIVRFREQVEDEIEVSCFSKL